MERLVSLKVVAGDVILLVDCHHLGVLFHGELVVECVPRAVRIGERSADQRACPDPAVVLRPAQQDLVQLAVVVSDAPFRCCGAVHAQTLSPMRCAVVSL